MALFGAIVAVGLGPALWLGAQFGTASLTPGPPPAVVGEQRVGTGKAPGRAGAAPVVEDEPVVRPTRRSGYLPLSSTPSARPSATASARPTTPTGDPTIRPVDRTAEPTPSRAPTTPPTESTSTPTEPPRGGGDVQPSGSVSPTPDDPVAGPAGVTLAGR